MSSTITGRTRNSVSFPNKVCQDGEALTSTPEYSTVAHISARAMLSDVEDIPWPPAEQRVGELLSLIAATREFQMA
jgi:hypothetical protein